jgi:hypothetical protein
MSREVIGIFESHSAYQREKRWRQVFAQVIEAYADIRSLPPIAAVTYDDCEKPNRKLNATAIEFAADVELATKKGLGGNPSLFAYWQRLVDGDETVPSAIASLIIRKCGRLYTARQLMPHAYFTVIKRGRSDRRSAPVGVAA